MSEIAKQLFQGMKGVSEAVMAVTPGLQDVAHETKGEISRLGTQGAMELASALFGNNAFVPYGPGQYTPKQEHENSGIER